MNGPRLIAALTGGSNGIGARNAVQASGAKAE